MIKIVEEIAGRWSGSKHPFLVTETDSLRVEEVLQSKINHLVPIEPGDVVALIGDFNRQSISDLLRLIDLGAIVMPLSPETRPDHDYFFKAGGVEWVIENGEVHKLATSESVDLVQVLRSRGNPGLILFSTGTTGKPKAILHDLSFFLARFSTPRPTLKTMAFLLFDHIGGLNTILHTIFNGGTIVATSERSPEKVLDLCQRESIQVLPTTPTFLRLLLLSGITEKYDLSKLEVVTYGTERMEQATLNALCALLPWVDFRQTYGMSELGILRVKSAARDSLYMRVGGEGVETKIVDGELYILSESRMMGYLNAQSPFTDDGWYATGDLVESNGIEIKIVGRKNDVINVGGLKFLPSQLEDVAICYPEVEFVKAFGKSNPVTGQHAEINVQPLSGFDLEEFKSYLEMNLPPHMRPRRIHVVAQKINHRFKKSG